VSDDGAGPQGAPGSGAEVPKAKGSEAAASQLGDSQDGSDDLPLAGRGRDGMLPLHGERLT
jgi:hypothetical protein